MWNQLHHDMVWQTWELLLHLHRHGGLQVQEAEINHVCIGQQSFDHRKLSPLVHIEELQPLHDLLTLLTGDHWASISQLHWNFPSFVILQLEEAITPFQRKVQIGQAAHRNDP